jgi:purine-cytosine permease-like protein
MIQNCILIYIIGCFISFSMFTISYSKFLQYTENNKIDFFMIMFIGTVLSWIVPIILFIDYIISEIKRKT